MTAESKPADAAASATPLAQPAGVVRLEVRDLEIRVGKSGPDVVGDISFAVPAGQVLGLVGESGSGKTTVALALLGHTRRGLRISSGEVRLDGVDLLTLSRSDLRAAGRRRARTTNANIVRSRSFSHSHSR